MNQLGEAMKSGLVVVLLSAIFSAHAEDLAKMSNPVVNVSRSGDAFEIEVSYLVNMDACNAFAFITDYEDASGIPGITESKIVSRIGNRVVVHRTVRDTLFLVPVQLDSTVEYTEIPGIGLNFEQIRGDNKIYRGTWRLEPQESAMKLTYRSVVEFDSLIPRPVIELFVESGLKERFGAMALRAQIREKANSPKCPLRH